MIENSLINLKIYLEKKMPIQIRYRPYPILPLICILISNLILTCLPPSVRNQK